MATRRGPDETVRAAFTGVFAGAEWANVMWFNTTHTSAITTTDTNALASDLYTVYVNSLLGEQSTTSVLLDCKLTYFPTGSSLVVVGEHTGTDNGARESGTDLPASVACCISWQAGVYWRGGKPRTYIGGMMSGNQDGVTTWDSGFTAAVQTDAAAFISGANALASGNFNSCTFGMVSFVSGGIDRTPPLFFPITGSSVNSRIDSQRRRLGK